MDIRKAFAASAYLLVLTGILSLSIAEGSPAIVLLSALLCFAAYWTVERMGRPIGRLGTNLAVFGVVLLTPADYAFISNDAVISTTHFLLAIQIVKLFGAKAPRDYLQLFAVSLIHLGVAAVITVELAFSVAFVIYLVVATWTLCLFLLARELEEHAKAEPGRLRSGRGLLGSTAVASVAALALTIVVFFIFPRFSAVIFDIKRGRSTQRLVGFTDQIGLTDLSEIRGNSEVVLQVLPKSLGSRFPAEPKWRGLAFDRYEGGRWSRSFKDSPRDMPHRRADPDWAPPLQPVNKWTLPPAPPAVAEAARRAAPEEHAEYTIIQAPLGLDSNVLFGVRRPERVEFRSTERPEYLLVDHGDAMLGTGLKAIEIMYDVRSLPPRREAAHGVPVDGVAARAGSPWLQLPRAPTLTARLAQIAADVIAAARATTPYEKCEALETFLATKYTYTLDLKPAPPGVDPVLHFLDDTKEGHCELSATAFVLMCRTQKIPARLVNGFQTGQWNDIGVGYWMVRQAEAHAWAEVCFSGEAGWIDFDPTPWATQGGAGVLSTLEKIQDYLRMRWISYVVSWSQGDQVSAAQGIKERVQRWTRELYRKLKSLRDRIPELSKEEVARRVWWLAGAGAVLFAALVWWTGRGRPDGRKAARPRAVRRVPFYEEWTRAAERRGWKRKPEETPMEHARRAAKEGGATLEGGPRLVEVFYRVRFAEEEMTAEERTLVEGIVAAALRREAAKSG